MDFTQTLPDELLHKCFQIVAQCQPREQATLDSSRFKLVCRRWCPIAEELWVARIHVQEGLEPVSWSTHTCRNLSRLLERRVDLAPWIREVEVGWWIEQEDESTAPSYQCLETGSERSSHLDTSPWGHLMRVLALTTHLKSLRIRGIYPTGPLPVLADLESLGVYMHGQPLQAVLPNISGSKALNTLFLQNLSINGETPGPTFFGTVKLQTIRVSVLTAVVGPYPKGLCDLLTPLGLGTLRSFKTDPASFGSLSELERFISLVSDTIETLLLTKYTASEIRLPDLPSIRSITVVGTGGPLNVFNYHLAVFSTLKRLEINSFRILPAVSTQAKFELEELSLIHCAFEDHGSLESYLCHSRYTICALKIGWPPISDAGLTEFTTFVKGLASHLRVLELLALPAGVLNLYALRGGFSVFPDLKLLKVESQDTLKQFPLVFFPASIEALFVRASRPPGTSGVSEDSLAPLVSTVMNGYFPRLKVVATRRPSASRLSGHGVEVLRWDQKADQWWEERKDRVILEETAP